ncbi:MAG: GGDEF domain-containing protein [Clostridium sp.]
MWLQVQIDIFMCILLCITLIHAYYTIGSKKPSYKLFIYINLSVLIILILEIASVVINRAGDIHLINIHKLVNVMGFSISSVIPFLFWVFTKKWINNQNKIGKEVYIFLIPVIISGILSVLSCKYNLIFTVTQENVYFRGPLFFIIPLVGYIPALGCIVLMFKNYKKLSTEELWIFPVYLIIPMILSIIQINNSTYLTIWSSSGICVIVLYIFILNERNKVDLLTGLNNRNALQGYITRATRRRNSKLTIINIDIDGFKSINDQYGHDEGDAALRQYAKILRNVFYPHSKIIRMGGDEFLVIMNGDNEEYVKNILNKLMDELEDYNNTSGKPYKFRCSYGTMGYDPKRQNIEDVMRSCDDLMYRHKKRNG